MPVSRSVRFFRNFASDPWKSMHRYSNEIVSAVRKFSDGLEISEYVPSEKLLSAGSTLGRRVLYPAAAKLKMDADVIHVLDQAYADLLHLKTRAAKIVTCHDLEFWRQRNFLNSSVRARLLAGIALADAVMCPSQAIRDELTRLQPKLHPKIHVIYNGVPENFKPGDRVAARRKLGLGSEFVALNVGTVELPRKNVSFLFGVFEEVKKRNVPLLFVQIGGKFTSDQYRGLAKAGLMSVARELGKVDDETLLDWYQAADVVVVPSLYEGFGLPVLEAMACGTPVVCSDIPVFNEISGSTGVALALVKDLWAQRLFILFQSQNAHAEASSAGIDRAKQFTYSIAGRRLADIYRAIEKSS